MKEIIIKEHTFLDKDFLSNPPNIVDLGSCRGEFILGFLDHFRNIKKAILVEANPTNFNSIPDFLKNEFVVLNNFISSESLGYSNFIEDPNSPYNGTNFFDYFSEGISHDIKKITLNDIRNEYGLEKIDILKIDIEGSEYEILESMDYKDFDGIDQITIEFHDFLDSSLSTRTKEIVEKIQKIGYKTINKGTSYKCGSHYYDTLFYK
jgi:FkbM family methyltransferase